MSRKEMQAVTALCPNLREVEFGHYTENGNDVLSSHQRRDFLLDSLNNCWKNVFHFLFSILITKFKLESVILLQVNQVMFYQVSSDFRRSVLSVLGPQLIKLEYNCKRDAIDIVTELLPCSQLGELSILDSNSVTVPQVEQILQIENFLPQLKKLHVASCVGKWSCLFECPRPSLTSLYLACPHFGMTDRSPFNWIDIPQLFPNLQHLHFDKSAAGLSLEILGHFVPKLKHLKTLDSFPENFRFG